ncbi:MAG TPA: hypothetical protein VFF69_10370 [Phycisphaerales bacterium]|nr:hypothetical protein [Phycisphaerales bacterium]
MHQDAHTHDHHGHAPDHTQPIPAHVDAWHRHGPSEGVPREEHASDANIPVLLASFVVITLGTLVFSVIIGIYTIGQVNQYKYAGEAEALGAMNQAARDYKRAALASQEGYGWLEDGRVRLPIAEAMRLVAEQSGENGGR